MVVTVVVGGFFGDEGKGKILSYLALRDNPDIVARGGVGPNAGHTVVYRGKEYKLRQVPSGFINPRSRLLIGPGVLVNPEVLLSEIEILSSFNVASRLGVDFQAGIIEPKHIEMDRELKKSIGTTGTGTGPANAERALRKLKVAREIESLKPRLTDVPGEIHEAIEEDKYILVEGTQGTFLSLYHGTYPYVTSKDVTASSILADVGIGPKFVDDVIVVFKSYVTRVGPGPLEGELEREDMERLGMIEFGSVTGRPRRAAPFSVKLARRAIMLNGATSVAITKLDVLFPEARGAKRLEDLPREAKKRLEEIEEAIKTPIRLISTGPGAEEIIDLRERIVFNLRRHQVYEFR